MVTRTRLFGADRLDAPAFKSINDNHGHDQGDAVLKEVTELLLRNNSSRETLTS